MEVLTCIHASSGIPSETTCLTFRQELTWAPIQYIGTQEEYLVLLFSVSVHTEMDDYDE